MSGAEGEGSYRVILSFSETFDFRPPDQKQKGWREEVFLNANLFASAIGISDHLSFRNGVSGKRMELREKMGDKHSSLSPFTPIIITVGHESSCESNIRLLLWRNNFLKVICF